MSSTTKTAFAEQQRRLGKTKRYRDRVNTMRAVIEYIAGTNRPVTEWRLFYAVKGGSQYFNEVVKEMKEYGLIKAVPMSDINPKLLNTRRQYGEVGLLSASKKQVMYVIATSKGLKFLRLSNGLAGLMPKAPWILENAS